MKWIHMSKDRFYGITYKQYRSQSIRIPMGGDIGDCEFSTSLLNVGDGKIPDPDGEIWLMASFCQIVPSLEKLIEKVYGHIKAINSHEDSWVCKCVILAPRNKQVNAIHNWTLQQFPVEERTYYSIKTVWNEEYAVYPIEFLNISVSDYQHTLALKVGVPLYL